MIRILLIAALTVSVFTAPAFAGYRKLMETFDQYHPPTFAVPETAEPGIGDTGSGPADAMTHRRVENRAAAFPIRLTGKQAAALGVDADRFAEMAGTAADAAASAARISGDFDLETVSILALQRNPGVRAAEHAARAAVEGLSQVTELESVLSRYTALNRGLMTGVGPMKGKDPVQMSFPRPGVTGLKGRIALEEIAVAVQDLAIRRKETAADVRAAFFNLAFVREARSVISETLRLLDHLEGVALTRYEAGAAAYQEPIRIRIKREKLKEELTTLKERQAVLETTLRSLLEIDSRQPVGRPLPPPVARTPVTAERIESFSLDHRPEIRKVDARIGKTEAMLEMTETMAVPLLAMPFSFYGDDPAASAGSFAMKPAFPEKTSAGVGIGAPMRPFQGANDAYIRSIRDRLKALEASRENEIARTRLMARSAWFRHDEALRGDRLFSGKVVDLGKTALDAAVSGYETGRVVFADVINSYETWLDARLMQLRRESDIGVARAEILRVAGRDLFGTGQTISERPSGKEAK